MRDDLRESFAFLPRSSEPWIWIPKPIESSVKKFIRGRSLPTGALSVERPAKNKLCRAIMFGSHLREPMVDQCGLPDASPGNNCDDIDLPVCPCSIQEGDILISTKNITSSNRQSGYGNLFRCRSYGRLASSDTRSGRGCLLQVLTSDSTTPVDSICYRRHDLQKFSWVLKAHR